MAHAHPVGLPYIRLDESDFEYDMRHRGYQGSRGQAIIFSHDTFDKDLDLPQRPDVFPMKNRLQSVLIFAGFKAAEIITYENKTGKETIKILQDVSKKDFSNMDCLVVIFLTHGDEYHNVYSYDIPLTYHMLMEPLKVANLEGLPKIFMVQASPAAKDKSPNEVHGPEMLHDAVVPSGTGSRYPLYKATDFLLIYSLLKGTSFVDAFCEVMRVDGRRLEIIQIISRVARMMSYPPNPKPNSAPKPNKYFPVPFVLSMMSKSFYFS